MGILKKGGPEGGDTSLGATRGTKESEQPSDRDTLPKWIVAMPDKGQVAGEKAKATKFHCRFSELEKELLNRARQDPARFALTPGKGLPNIFDSKNWEDDEVGYELAEEYQAVSTELEKIKRRYDLGSTFASAV